MINLEGYHVVQRGARPFFSSSASPAISSLVSILSFYTSRSPQFWGRGLKVGISVRAIGRIFGELQMLGGGGIDEILVRRVIHANMAILLGAMGCWYG